MSMVENRIYVYIENDVCSPSKKKKKIMEQPSATKDSLNGNRVLQKQGVMNHEVLHWSALISTMIYSTP